MLVAKKRKIIECFLLIPQPKHSQILKTIQSKVLLLFSILLLSLPLCGQPTPIDSLANLSIVASTKEKVMLLSRIEAHLKKANNETLINQFLEIAKTRNDSIFLASAYRQKGAEEIQKNIARSYGFHLEELENIHPLYNSLSVFHDKKGNYTIEEIRNQDQLFGINRTLTTAYNYIPEEVYWGKLILHGNSEKTANYLIHFSSNPYLFFQEQI